MSCTGDKDQDARTDVPALQGWSNRRSCSHMLGRWLGRTAPRHVRSAMVEEREVLSHLIKNLVINRKLR